MHNIFLVHVKNSRQNLFHNLGGFLFGEYFVLLDSMKKVTSLTELHYQDKLLLPFEYLEKLDDVRMVELHWEGDLRKEFLFGLFLSKNSRSFYDFSCS
jgi:hypothetical protein